MSRSITATNRGLLRYAAWLLLSFVYLLCACEFSSPLTGFTGIDYDMFRVGGEYLLRGELYTGFFDNKGPYLFAINALGLLISHTKWGIFTLEVLCLSWLLEMLWRMGRALHATAKACAWGIAYALSIFIFTIAYGDSVEFWSLLPIVWALLVYIRRPGRRSSYIVYGIAVGILAFLRLNGAITPLAIILAEAATVINGSQWKRLGLGSLCVIGGLVMGAAPAIIWFACLGSLPQMLDATFIYNMQYAALHGANGLRGMAVTLSLLGVCFLLPVVAWRTRLGWMLIINSALLIITMVRMWVLIHYMTVLLPLNFLLIVIGSQTMQRRWLIFWAVLLALPYAIRDPESLSGIWQRTALQAFDEKTRDSLQGYDRAVMERAVAIIPPQERDSIYEFEIVRKYWGMSHYIGYRPVGRYFNQQSHITEVRAGVYGTTEPNADITEQFDRARPLWIISNHPLRYSIMASRWPLYERREKWQATPDLTFYIYRRK